MACIPFQDKRFKSGYGVSYCSASDADPHDLRDLLADRKEALQKRQKGQAASIFDIYGASGFVWGLFHLFCGKLYDCEEQAGESGSWEHYFPVPDLCIFAFAGAA